MAWETRSSGHYYYRKAWKKGTCTSEYVGSGLLGDLASSIDALEQQKREEERRDFTHFMREQRRIDRMLDDHHNAVREQVATVLQQLGYHQHRRQWRMKRKESKVSNEITHNATVATKEEVSTYIKLFRAAQGKKAKSPEVKQLQEYADQHPAVFGQLSGSAYGTLCGVIEAATSDEAMRVHLHGEVCAMKRALGIDTATRLERMLIEDVALCWVRLQALESMYTAKYNSDDGVTLSYAGYLENRLSATQRRYLRAVESLARVRGLLVRAGVQINIAQQQVVQNG